jgi:hypothetical protein
MCATSQPRSRHYTKKNYHSQNSEFTIMIEFPSRYSFFNFYTTQWSLVEIWCHAILCHSCIQVLHTWFHKNSRQCALSLVCCSKSYQLQQIIPAICTSGYNNSLKQWHNSECNFHIAQLHIIHPFLLPVPKWHVL